MKTKTFIIGLVMFLAFSTNASFSNAQDQQQNDPGKSVEAQDSAKMNDMLFYDLKEEKQGPSTGLYIGIAAAVLVGGGIGIFYFRKKKK